MLTLLDKPIDELAADVALRPDNLALIQMEIAGAKAQLKRREEVFAAIMDRSYGAAARTQYQIAKKDTGTVHIPASNTLNLTVEVDSTVIWDQAILRNMREQMTAEERAHYLKEKLEVADAIFKASPPAIKTALQRARTVKPGKMKFTFKPAAEAA